MKAALNVGAAVGGPANATATVTPNTAATASTALLVSVASPILALGLMCCAALSTTFLTKRRNRPYEGGNHTPRASAARFDLIVRGFGRLRALGLWQTTGIGSPNARSLPPTSRSRSNASHTSCIAVTRESGIVPVGDRVGGNVGGNVGGFVSPVLVGVGVGDAVGAAA